MIKCILKYIFASFILFATACIGGGSGCEEQFSNAKSLGTISVESESANWIPEITLDTLYFKNNKGVYCAFKLINNTSSYDNEYNLFLNNDMSGGECVTKGYVSVYCEKPKFRLNSLDAPFMINLSRLKIINENILSDTITLDDLKTVSDKIEIRIGYDANYFVIADSSKFLLGEALLVDSIYKSVYRIPGSSSGQPGATEYYYLQRGKGLIGFKFLNGETWARK